MQMHVYAVDESHHQFPHLKNVSECFQTGWPYTWIRDPSVHQRPHRTTYTVAQTGTARPILKWGLTRSLKGGGGGAGDSLTQTFCHSSD